MQAGVLRGEHLEGLYYGVHPVEVRLELREYEAAGLLSHDAHPFLRGRLHEPPGRRLGPLHLEAVVLGHPVYGARGGYRDGYDAVAPEPLVVLEAQKGHDVKGRVPVEHLAGVVADVYLLAPGVEVETHICVKRPYYRRKLVYRLLELLGRPRGARSVEVGVKGDDIAVQLAENGGEYAGGRAEGVVEDYLEVRPPNRVGVYGGHEAVLVVLEPVYGKIHLAGLVHGDALEVLPEKELLYGLLVPRVEVEPLVVEELQVEELGVVRRAARVYAADLAAAARQEPADRHGGDAVVVDIHAGGEYAGHHRPVYHAGSLVSVAAGGDNRTPLERGPVGRAELGGELRGKLYVGKSGDPVCREYVPAPLLSPYQRAGEYGVVVHLLVRPDLDIGLYRGVPADLAVVAYYDPFGEVRALAYLRIVCYDILMGDGAPADLDFVPEDRVPYDRALFYDGVIADYRVRYPDIGFYPAVGADYNAAFELRGVVYARVLAHPYVPALDPVALYVYLHPALQDVDVSRPVLLQGPDILPVALGHIAVDGLLIGEKRGEKLLAEVELHALGQVVEHLFFQYVDAGVDGVAENLPPARLLKEPDYSAVLVGYDYAEGQRVIDPCKHYGGDGLFLAVELDGRLYVKVGQDISAYDERCPVVLPPPHRASDGPCRAKVLRGGYVVYLHPEAASVAQMVSNLLRLKIEQGRKVGYGVLFKELDYVLHYRPVGHRDHRLGKVVRKRAQPCAETSGHDDALQRVASTCF